MVGPIEIIPPSSSASARSARATPLDPVAEPGDTARRHGRAASRPAAVVIDIDAAGNPRAAGPTDSVAGGRPAGTRRVPPTQPVSESRRSPFSTATPDAADKPALRSAGMLAYRNADGLAADYAHRGTFYDLSV